MGKMSTRGGGGYDRAMARVVVVLLLFAGCSFRGAGSNDGDGDGDGDAAVDAPATLWGTPEIVASLDTGGSAHDDPSITAAGEISRVQIVNWLLPNIGHYKIESTKPTLILSIL
jgi:hypothetical protein